METKKIILEVLGEGGSISLYKKENRFFFQTNEGALLDMLDEEDRVGLESIKKSYTFDNFEDAFESMQNKYPLFKLYPAEIDPEYANAIKIEYLNFCLKSQNKNFRSQEKWKKMLNI